MILQEIEPIIFDDVCLYRKDIDDFKDLWRGKAQDIPEEFLAFTVESVGAKRHGILDIELRV